MGFNREIISAAEMVLSACTALRFLITEVSALRAAKRPLSGLISLPLNRPYARAMSWYARMAGA